MSFQPIVVGQPQPFDLLVVADHSGSLAWSRDALTAGLQDLLTHVRGRAARVFLLTPTQYGASSAAARDPDSGEPLVAWQDPDTGNAYGPAMTDYTQACTDENGASMACPEPDGVLAYDLEGTWDFVMPGPIAVLSADSSDDDFAAQQVAVATAVLNLPSTGSPLEQPLCTLGRYIRQQPSLLPPHAVFLIISDEDDTSLPKDCVLSHSVETSIETVVSSEAPCSTDCDGYRYSMPMLRTSASLTYTCQAHTDTGDPIPGTEQAGSVSNGPCNSAEPGPCSEEERAIARHVCDSGLDVVDCERACTEQEHGCLVTLDENVDACSQSFEYHDATWDDLEHYCTSTTSVPIGPCEADGGVTFEYETKPVTSSSLTTLVTGSTPDDLARDFRQRADDHFGEGQYLVQGILLDPTLSCEPGPGQSFATNLVQLIDDPGHVFPLCESYAPALANVLDFANTFVQTEFELSLADDEEVTTITIMKANGEELTLGPDQFRFDRDTQTLHVATGVIVETDTDLTVEVTSACRPVVK